MYQNIDSSGSNQIQTPQYPYAQPEDTNELFQELLEDFQIIRDELSEYINSPSWNYPTFYDDDEEHSVQYTEYLEKSPDAVTTILPTEEPEYSLSMGYEHPNTTLEMESNEIIKSGVEDLVPIPNECEVTSEDKKECDMLVCEDSSTFDVYEDHSKILSILTMMIFQVMTMLLRTSKEEVDLEDIFQIQDVVLREKLLSINRLIANIESLNYNPTPDCVLNSSSSFPIFEESDNSISLSDNSSPEFETFRDHTKETRSGSTTTHADNSLPEYDSFCFKIEPDLERLTSIVKNDISDDSSIDLLLEEVDLFLASDNSIPSGIENFNYDSEGEIYVLEELLVDNFIPSSENKLSDFNQDDPLFPRPPPEPPDVEFDFKPNSGEEILAVMNDNDELECFDPG
uniref:Reverse transcriptase domain-containing protein n=1 Tax=Tanacetum cinerariifolium TaxID=118510 RepID=A0A699H4S5_TANCI|nr:hypothetical protein [Tanacetum cinerariifolium]